MIRRYQPINPSRGTVIPTSTRLRVLTRDAKATGGCVGFQRLPGECQGGLELDHVRGSGGMSMKSVTCDCNLLSLCNAHHLHKTLNGRADRPILLDYLAEFGYTPHEDGHLAAIVNLTPDCTHVDPVFGCSSCMRRRVPA